MAGGAWVGSRTGLVDAAVRRLLECGRSADGHPCGQRQPSLAFRAIGVLRMAGCRVPEDVALVGFDDIPLAQEMLPPLTTLGIPLAEIGRRAAGQLLRLIASAEAGSGRQDVIGAELIPRGTA